MNDRRSVVKANTLRPVPEPRTRRRESPEVRREQILDAAERVLLERGLATTTVADVAETAGVAKGTVYLYFESKDAILSGLRARYLERFADAVTQPRARSTASELDHFVEGLFDFSVANSGLHHLLFHEAGFSEDDAFASTRTMVADLIAAGCDRGDFQVSDPELATDFVFHGVHGALTTALHGARPSRRRFVDHTTALVRGALGADR
jgi:TetR/AcrR family transcriptional repressor of nem operon